MMDEKNAINGALVADAASMGLHWIYEQDHLQALEKTGDLLFRHPDPAVYKDRKAFFAHAPRRSGELSHYGESARLVAQLAYDGEYDTQSHQQAFMASFGPCGSYVGYADRPTKALVAKLIMEADAIQNPSGLYDDQLPALCVVPGLFVSGANQQKISEAATVLSTHEHVQSGVAAVSSCLLSLKQGNTIKQALSDGIKACDSELGQKLQEAMDWSNYDPLNVAEHVGLACKVHMGLPLSWHLLLHAKDFESTIRDNIRCGGDTCGRAMVLGAIAGYLFGVPDSLKRLMLNARIPVRYG